jgi:hypothetical protein
MVFLIEIWCLLRSLELNSLYINHLNAELNLIFHLLTLLGAYPIFHISRVTVKPVDSGFKTKCGSHTVHKLSQRRLTAD